MIHIKNKSEIEKMYAACQLAAEVLERTGELVKAGISTQELNDFADEYTIKKGARSAPLNYKGFPRSICTSINEVVCHGIPDPAQILRDGDIINIDITVVLDGFHGDTSRTFAVGPISESTTRLVQDTQKAMYHGIAAIQPGNRVLDIGAAIDNYLTPLGYGIVRDLTGHGIGREFHEKPAIPHYKNQEARDRLKAGMTFTVEPMVNAGTWEVDFDQNDGWTVRTKDRRLSAQFEHTCLVTKDGYRILTRL
ncbi:MAG: type I methionyl aminopeptidase [Leptospiraceae bacterium]|nr:type I methionyl aminopeptidase [Leptospiraceae bacterium]